MHFFRNPPVVFYLHFYSKIFGWDKKQIDDFFRNDRIEVVDNAKPRESAVSVIKKLKEEGHNIYIITARTNKYDDIPYERTRNWLDKNKIVYDKLIIGAVDKAKVCKNLGINIFIDDQINNCIDLEKNGFIVIRLTDSNDIYENIINVTNFKDVYNYINKLGE